MLSIRIKRVAHLREVGIKIIKVVLRLRPVKTKRGTIISRVRAPRIRIRIRIGNIILFSIINNLYSIFFFSFFLYDSGVTAVPIQRIRIARERKISIRTIRVLRVLGTRIKVHRQRIRRGNILRRFLSLTGIRKRIDTARRILLLTKISSTDLRRRINIVTKKIGRRTRTRIGIDRTKTDVRQIEFFTLLLSSSNLMTFHFDCCLFSFHS